MALLTIEAKIECDYCDKVMNIFVEPTLQVVNRCILTSIEKRLVHMINDNHACEDCYHFNESNE